MCIIQGNILVSLLIIYNMKYYFSYLFNNQKYYKILLLLLIFIFLYEKNFFPLLVGTKYDLFAGLDEETRVETLHGVYYI
jgi:hypothetical protein